MIRYRRIERSPDDYVKPWPFLDQLACAGVGLVVIAFMVMVVGGMPL